MALLLVACCGCFDRLGAWFENYSYGYVPMGDRLMKTKRVYI